MSVERNSTAVKGVDENDTQELYTVDIHYPHQDSNTVEVQKDYSCMLYRADSDLKYTDFYLMQLLINGPHYVVWTRWGRIGKVGQSLSVGPYIDLNEAVKYFENTFKQKTANEWKNRKNFVACRGKFIIVDSMDKWDRDENGTVLISSEKLDVKLPVEAHPIRRLPCKLKKETADMLRLSINDDAFAFVMESLNLNTKKIHLEQLNLELITKGFDILDRIQQAPENSEKQFFKQLSSAFHALFRTEYHYIIKPGATLESEWTMLLILSDIIRTRQLIQESEIQRKQAPSLVPDLLDVIYDQLNYTLGLLHTGSEYNLVMNYFNNTKLRCHKLSNIWRIHSKGCDHTKKHDELGNRKLLFHACSIGSVLAILKHGLRIIPHDEASFGRGLYFASQSEMSMDYSCGDRDDHYFMFLVEVVLGKEFEVRKTTKGICEPPPGFDSVRIVGFNDYDEKYSKSIELDGRKVMVPFSQPFRNSEETCFISNEFIVYDESRCQLRYLIEY